MAANHSQDEVAPLWEQRLFGLLNVTAVAIVEALLRIEEPLSARLLVDVFDRRHQLNELSYHVRRLAAAGVIREVDWAQRRGAREHLYLLVDTSDADTGDRESI